MKKAYVIRYGAFGDTIHCSHIPRLLKEKEGFDHVTFEYNPKAYPILYNNPFIDEHIHFDPHSWPICTTPLSYLQKRWKLIYEEGHYTHMIQLQNSIEYGYIAMEDTNEYYMSDKERREMFGKHNYYDVTTIAAGYPQHVGMKGDIFFEKDEIELVDNIFKERYEGKFVVVVNLSGTSKHKLFYGAEAIIKEFLSRHDDAVCITMGDDDCKKHIEFKGDRIINRCGEFAPGMHYPIKQSMLVCKKANLVIGCESGLMVAATLLGSPVIQLMTAASIKNHGGDFSNDRSLQSPCRCSPCHKGPYEYIGCPKFDYLNEKYPLCIKFDPKTVLERMEKVYDDDRNKKEIGSAELSSVR